MFSIQSYTIQLLTFLQFLCLVYSQIEYCKQASADGSSCIQCLDGFQRVSNSTLTSSSSSSISSYYCTSACDQMHYYSNESNSCVSTCAYNEISNSTVRGCNQINVCPTLSQQGHSYHTGAVNGIIVIQDSLTHLDSMMVSFSNVDNLIKLWDAATGRFITSFQGHTSPVLQIKYNSLQSQLVSIAINGEVITWDITKGKILSVVVIPLGSLKATSSIDIQNTLITSFGFQGEFYLFNYTTLAGQKYIGHSNIVDQTILYSTNQIISSSQDKNILLWNTVQGTFHKLCSQVSPPKQIFLLIDSLGPLTLNLLFSFGSTGSDATLLFFTNLQSQNPLCSQVTSSIQHQFAIINIISDLLTHRLITYSQQEIFVWSYIPQITSGSLQIVFTVIQQILPATIQSYGIVISGAYLSYSVLGITSSTGNIILGNYLLAIPQPGQNIITLPPVAQLITLSRPVINGLSFNLMQMFMYIYGDQIYQINLAKASVVYVINNLIIPFIKNTQVVPKIDFNQQLYLVVSTSADGLTMVYDYETGQLISMITHPGYPSFGQGVQPQGLCSVIHKDGTISIAYNDRTLVCYNSLTTQPKYIFNYSETILRIFKDDTNLYLIVTTLNEVFLYNIATGGLITSYSLPGQFYYSEFFPQLVFVSGGITGVIVRWNYPDMTIQVQGNDNGLNNYTPPGNWVGFGFGSVFTVLISYYDNGLSIVYDQNMSVIKSYKVEDQLTRCGIIYPVFTVCISFSGKVYSYGIYTNAFFVQSLLPYPLIKGDILYKYNKVAFVIYYGTFGGAVIIANLATLLAEQQFLSPSPIVDFTTDDFKQRIFYPNQEGDIMVSHFNPVTNTQIPRGESSNINNVMLIPSQSKLVILSNIILMYDYSISSVYSQNTFHQQAVLNCVIDATNNIIVSYNADKSKNLQIWKYNNNQIIELDGHTNGVINSLLILDSNVLISYDQNGIIIVWQYPTNTIVTTITQHQNLQIINVQVFNQYNTYIISYDSSGNLYTTNYMNGSIQKLVQVPNQNNFVIDYTNNNIYIYGTNVVVYSAITSTKLTDILGFDGQVQAVLFKNSYTIAYSNQNILSIQSSSLSVLYSGKFNYKIYMLTLIQNLAAMIGNQVDNTINIWDYTTGVMMSNIVNTFYPSPSTYLFSDENSQILITMNNLNQIFTYLPFSAAILKQKDFLLNPTYQATPLLDGILIDQVANLMFVFNDNNIYLWNYYTYLGLQGDTFILPSNSLIVSAYNQKTDQIFYSDLERNLWVLQQNQQQYATQLSHTPLSAVLNGNCLVTTNGINIYSINSSYQQISSIKIYPTQIYTDSNFPFIFAVIIDASIVQLYIDPNTCTLQPMMQYQGDLLMRTKSLVLVLPYTSIIAHDIFGNLAIYNFMTKAKIFAGNIHSALIRDIIVDYNYKLLVTCSDDGNIKIFQYDGTSTVNLMKTISVSGSQISWVVIDKARQEFVYYVDNQQLIYFLDLSNSYAQKMTLMSPGMRMIQINISNQYSKVAVFCPFQVNLYQHADYSLINIFRNPSTIYDIKELYFISQTVLLIQCLSQLILVEMNSSAVSILKQFPMQFSVLLEFDYQANQIMTIKGLNLQNSFNYTFTLLSGISLSAQAQEYSLCYQQFTSTNTYFAFKQELQLQEDSFAAFQQQVTQVIYDVYLNKAASLLYVSDSQLSLYNKNVNKQYFYMSTPSSLITYLFVSHTDFNKNTFQLQDFVWQLQDNFAVQFSPQTQQIMMINSIINSPTITNSTFILQNINSVFISVLNITNVVFDGTSSSNPVVFLQFSNVQSIYIEKLILTNIEFKNYILISTINCQSVTIKEITISNISFPVNSSARLRNLQSSTNTQVQNIFINIVQSQTVSLVDFNMKNVVSPYLFSLLNLQSNKYVDIDTFTGVTLKNIVIANIMQSFSQPKVGLFQVYDDTIILENINMVGVTTSQSIFQVQSDNLLVNNTYFKSIVADTSNGSVLYIYSSTFTVNNSTFTENKSLLGGSIYTQYCKGTSMISNSEFLQNVSEQGGAIYLNTCDINFSNSVIQQNTAYIGGGIRYIGLIPQFVSSPKQLASITQNKASIFGQNIASYPRAISIFSNNSGFNSTSTQQSNLIAYQINNFMSGDILQFSAKLFDEENNSVDLSILNNKNLISSDLYNEISAYQLNCYSTNSDSINLSGQTLSQHYNFTSKMFEFNQLVIKAAPSTNNNFTLQNNFLFIPDPKQSQQFYQLDTNIEFDIQFRVCMIGEVYVAGTIDSPPYCLPCPVQKYSLKDPNNPSLWDNQEQSCSLCPTTAESCQGDQISLKSGYWKESFYSDNILDCYNKPQNCKGGVVYSQSLYDVTMLNYCEKGYIGPLCEECDISGKSWNQTYMNNGQYNCVPCQGQQSLVSTYGIAISVGSIYLIYGIRQSLQSSIIKAYSYYIRMLGLASIGKSDSADQSAVLLKFLMHFLQMSSIAFKISLPFSINLFSVSIGTPIDAIKYSQDCKSVFASSVIPPVYGRVIWSQVIALFYVVILSLTYLCLVLFKVIQPNRHYKWNAMMFLYLFLQPNITSGLISIMSCRSIGSMSYVLADVTLECNTNQHLTFVVFLVIPLFIFWNILIPIFVIILLRRSKTKLDTIQIRLKFGFLYQEYKFLCYYWEFSKIILRVTVIFVATYFRESAQIQSTLCSLIIFSYIILAIIKKPFLSIEFNRIDFILHVVLIFCLQLQIVQNSNEVSSLTVLTQALIAIATYGFLGGIALKFILAKSKIVLLATLKKYPYLMNWSSTIKMFYNINTSNTMNVFKNWQRIHKIIKKNINLRNLAKQDHQQLQTPMIRRSFDLLHTYSKINSSGHTSPLIVDASSQRDIIKENTKERPSKFQLNTQRNSLVTGRNGTDNNNNTEIDLDSLADTERQIPTLLCQHQSSQKNYNLKRFTKYNFLSKTNSMNAPMPPEE